MKNFLWLDDIRPMPDGFDHWSKTAENAIDYIKNNRVTYISFDHDLGTARTGYDVALFIEQRASKGIKPPDWSIHSQNPVGAQNIRVCMLSADVVYEIAKNLVNQISSAKYI